MITQKSAETLQFGRDFARKVPAGAVLALYGDLGAGKTTLAKGFISALTSLPETEIQSPTFTYLNIYDERVFHFDLYRLKGENDFVEMGFTDFLSKEGICLIEWPERIEKLLPKETIFIELFHEKNGKRRIHVHSF